MKTKDGKMHKADKVVCALPLSMYQEKIVEFTPELPKEKLSAIDRLGAGLIEKVTEHNVCLVHYRFFFHWTFFNIIR